MNNKITMNTYVSINESTNQTKQMNKQKRDRLNRYRKYFDGCQMGWRWEDE